MCIPYISFHTASEGGKDGNNERSKGREKKFGGQRERERE
jgi:hypothetical protein